MAASLAELQGKLVSVITGDGRQILGNLKGYDQTINLVLEGCSERIYSQARGVEQGRFYPNQVQDAQLIKSYHPSYVLLYRELRRGLHRGVVEWVGAGLAEAVGSTVQLGLYICRGDNIAVIGEFDEEADATKDLSRVRADPLKPVTH